MQLDAAAAQTQQLLKTLWTRNLPVVRERLELLERAADGAQRELLTSSLRSDAVMTAHKLAGSLGMFGYHEGTRLARELELIFDHPGVPGHTRLPMLLRELRRSLTL